MPGGVYSPPSPVQVPTGKHRYALGAVKPYVRDAAQVIGDRFDVRTVYGVSIRPNPSDHMKGLALDFMVYADRAKGDAIASYVVGNASALHVQYVIWNQRIWNIDRSSEGWRAMENRGSPTANHKDHVHVSFKDVGGGVSLGNLVDNLTPDAVTDPLSNALGPIKSLADAVGWLMDGGNLLRVAMFLGGGVLLLVALVGWAAVSSGVVNAVKGTR